MGQFNNVPIIVDEVPLQGKNFLSMSDQKGKIFFSTIQIKITTVVYKHHLHPGLCYTVLACLGDGLVCGIGNVMLGGPKQSTSITACNILGWAIEECCKTGNDGPRDWYWRS